MTKPPEISRQEVEVYRVLSANRGRWLSNAQLTEYTQGVAPRTVRAVTRKLAQAGVVDLAPVHGGYCYRFAAATPQAASAYLARLHQAAEVLGITLNGGRS